MKIFQFVRARFLLLVFYPFVTSTLGVAFCRQRARVRILGAQFVYWLDGYDWSTAGKLAGFDAVERALDGLRKANVLRLLRK